MTETHSSYNINMADDDERNESGDYKRFGIPDAPKTTVTTPFGKTKTWAGLQKGEIIYLLLSFLNIITAVGLTVYSLVKVLKDPTSPDLTFTILIIVNAAFIAFYAFHGVIRERKYELYVQVVAIGIILLYCIVEYSVKVDKRSAIKLARLIIACILAPPNIALSIYVAKDFGELEFRIAGASAYLQSIYNEAAIFSCWLKFDFQVTVSLVILVLEDGSNLNTVEIVTLAVGIPFSLLWDIFGWIVLRLELKVCSFIFAFIGIVKPAYCAYKIAELYLNLDSNIGIITYGVLISGGLQILVWMILMIELHRVYSNYGKGLREREWFQLTEQMRSTRSISHEGASNSCCGMLKARQDTQEILVSGSSTAAREAPSHNGFTLPLSRFLWPRAWDCSLALPLKH